MKKITNPKEYTADYHSEQGGNHKVETKVIQSTDISDQVVDDRVEIKSGESIIASERTAEEMSKKYPWLIVEDYEAHKEAETKKEAKKYVKKTRKNR